MILNKSFEYIKQNPQFLDDHLNLLNLLIRSGLLEYLRTAGLSYLNAPYKDATEAALNGARAQGWQACLDTILTFKEAIYGPGITPNTVAQVRPDFGSLSSALQKGDLTEEEVNAIRTNTKPAYTNTSGPAVTTTSSRADKQNTTAI